MTPIRESKELDWEGEHTKAACAHLKVIYKRIEHEGGTCSDSWLCADCETPFWPHHNPTPAGEPWTADRLVKILRQDRYDVLADAINAALAADREARNDAEEELRVRREQVKQLREQLDVAVDALRDIQAGRDNPVWTPARLADAALAKIKQNEHHN